MNEARVSPLGFRVPWRQQAPRLCSPYLLIFLCYLFSPTHKHSQTNAFYMHIQSNYISFYSSTLKLSRYSCVNCPFSNSVILASNFMQSPLSINLTLLHSCLIFLSPLSFTHNSLKFTNTKTATRAVFVSSPHIKSRN